MLSLIFNFGSKHENRFKDDLQYDLIVIQYL